MGVRASGPPLRLEYLPLSDLLAWPTNAKDHDVGLIDSSIRRFGFVEPFVLDERTGHLAAGHGRRKALEARWRAGESPPPNVMRREDGAWLVPVVRGWASATDRELDALTVALNRSVILGGWDEPKLKDLLLQLSRETPAGLEGTGYDADDLQALISNLDALADVPPPSAPPAEPWVKPGDLFELGCHRLLCGNSARPDQAARVLRGVTLDAILTDPPYCSGGFREADRARGSIGRLPPRSGQRHAIAYDQLSSRGYRQLLTAVLDYWPADIAYVFCDWRMWCQLIDVFEGCGLYARAQLIWDKGTPGVGAGWRYQHELIACGSRILRPFSLRGPSHGTVFRIDRTDYEHHPTEKPVELLRHILDVTASARTIGDPFAGAGSTLLACEQLGRTCYAAELNPAFVQVALDRWAQLTGQRWRRVEAAEAGEDSVPRRAMTRGFKRKASRRAARAGVARVTNAR